jgi:hypothetical protein
MSGDEHACCTSACLRCHHFHAGDHTACRNPLHPCTICNSTQHFVTACPLYRPANVLLNNKAILSLSRDDAQSIIDSDKPSAIIHPPSMTTGPYPVLPVSTQWANGRQQLQQQQQQTPQEQQEQQQQKQHKHQDQEQQEQQEQQKQQQQTHPAFQPLIEYHPSSSPSTSNSTSETRMMNEIRNLTQTLGQLSQQIQSMQHTIEDMRKQMEAKDNEIVLLRRQLNNQPDKRHKPSSVNIMETTLTNNISVNATSTDSSMSIPISTSIQPMQFVSHDEQQH